MTRRNHLNNDDQTPTYWTTEISSVTPEKVFVRGYDLEDLIGVPFGAAAYLLIRGQLPTPNQTRMMDCLLTAILDYGLEKAGTVAARAIVSSNPSMQAGFAGAVLASGEYSMDPQDTASFIAQQHQLWSDSGLSMEDFAASQVEQFTARRFRVPGFGHPVFRGVDPRAAKLKSVALEGGMWAEPAQVYEAIHTAFIQNPKVAHFPINDIGMLAAIATAMDFTPAETTALALIGTLPGVAAHVSEEIASGHRIRRVPQDQATYNVPLRQFTADWQAKGN